MKKRILFICTANSARSLMAEALLKELAPSSFEVASAGTHPEEAHPLALKALSTAGLSTQGLQASSVAELADQNWDYVISLCDQAANECANLMLGAQHINWDFPDPAKKPTAENFSQILKEIRERIRLFILVHQKHTVSTHLANDPVTLFKALGDPSTLAILLLTYFHRELCVCELTEALQVSQPKVSRHLAVLRESGLLEGERRGQWIHYHLHPQLEDWALQILSQTAKAHRQTIFWHEERLAQFQKKNPIKETP
jgi:ArsR family transcriptional regulator